MRNIFGYGLATLKRMVSGRQITVVYTAPGFLLGTYAVRFPAGTAITEDQLLDHAIRARFGSNFVAIGNAVNIRSTINIVVKRVF